VDISTNTEIISSNYLFELFFRQYISTGIEFVAGNYRSERYEQSSTS
jgi:hypothetical protein